MTFTQISKLIDVEKHSLGHVLGEFPLAMTETGARGIPKRVAIRKEERWKGHTNTNKEVERPLSLSSWRRRRHTFASWKVCETRTFLGR